MNSTLFKWCRQFYLLYPQIGATVSNQFELIKNKEGWEYTWTNLVCYMMNGRAAK